MRVELAGSVDPQVAYSNMFAAIASENRPSWALLGLEPIISVRLDDGMREEMDNLAREDSLQRHD